MTPQALCFKFFIVFKGCDDDDDDDDDDRNIAISYLNIDIRFVGKKY